MDITSTSDEKLTPSSVTINPPAESETNGTGIMCCPPTSGNVALASLIPKTIGDCWPESRYIDTSYGIDKPAIFIPPVPVTSKSIWTKFAPRKPTLEAVDAA